MTESKTMHEGRNVKRIREMLGIKQEALASDLGLSQQAISSLEQKEALDTEMLEKISQVLKVPVEAIKNFDEEKAIYNIQNNYDNATLNVNYQFNPIEKIVQLYDDKVALLERLLQSEKDKVEMLERMMKERQIN
jgi:transcriptional regulator with XRE-family HTH domain